MENLFYNISQVLGITVVHSLWQGLIIYMLLRIFILVLPHVPAAVKYRVAFAALTGVLGWFLYTLFLQLINYEWQSAQPVTLNVLALPGIIDAGTQVPVNKYYVTIAGYMPYVTVLYVVGLVFNTLKLAFAWNNIYQIRKYVTQTEFATSIRKLSSQLNLKTKVEAAFSEWVDVPCITGFFKPIILLPISISCYLNTEEVEAILLHELAHVKRNDYLHNFIQQVIGIMLFFNPFARLISKVISEEREHSCDDLVIETTSRPFIYAQTLLKLEENKQYQWQLALAATGKRKFELLNRIERIMKTKKHTINIRPVLVTVLALTLGITSIAWLNPKVEDGKLKVKNLDPTIKMLTAFTSGGDISSAEPIATNTASPLKAKKHKLTLQYPDATFSDLGDTTKKPGKYKIIIEDENGMRKEYNSAADLPLDIKNEIDVRRDYNLAFKLGNDTAFTEMNRYFESAAFKKNTAAFEKQALAMAKKFENKDWKKRQADIEKQAQKLVKRFENPEWKKIQADIEKQAADIEKDYKNADSDARRDELIQKSIEFGLKAAEMVNSPEFKKQLAENDKMINSQEFKKYMVEVEKATGSPAFKKQQVQIEKMIKSPAFKKQQVQIEKMINNPAWQKAQQKVVERTMQVLKRVKERPENLKEVEKVIELKELPELPEKPEAPEKPEVKEAPEAKEATKAPAAKSEVTKPL
ncbi:M56 family metallopeptidase [Mucilaginibacter calamicampi]|uniref:M56 family metallopeptidase n=1 Tax=Mucilaginibacter calamicampi TaxID=1302352 RepID=A0ABW2Z6H1_9SPHI